jgi:hypothetical protein
MSDLLNSASLVLIPSGYKEDIVYSAVPTDGSGDLSFTRASNGTRVNSAGLVEVVAWNLVSYSNTFTNGVWVTSGYGNLPTLTANSIANPVNGLVDAWTASFAAAGTQGRLLQTFTGLPVGVPYTFSIYIKAGTKTIVTIMSDTASIGLEANFNLSTGVLISKSTAVTATITAMSNGWYFLTMTNNILSSGNGQYGIVTGPGDDGSLYIYGAQLNIGSTAKPYFPTTDRLNVPRLTYQNGGGGCPSLLLEKQSTNLAFPSEDLTALTAGGMTNTANQTISPDGTQNADKSTIGSTARYYDVVTEPVVTTTNGTTYTTSFFAKKGTGIEAIYFYQGDGNRIAKFNLNNGAYIGHAPSDSYNPFTSQTSESLGNGWYRFTATYTASGIVGQFVIGISTNTNNSVTPISGNGTDFVYVWGLQYEASSYPTSYIPTTSASATRVADACSKTGISSLIGQTSGTLFVDSTLTHIASSNEYLIQVSASGTNRFFIYREGNSNKLGCFAIVAGTVIYTQLTATAITDRVKVAFAYQSGSLAFYVNGVQVGTSAATFGTPASMGIFNIDSNDGTENGFYNYNQAILFPTRLTNAELASLTTI